MTPPNGRTEIEAVFGSPANADGKLNQPWCIGNISLWTPPSFWRLYYQDDAQVTPSRGIQVHRLLHDSLTKIFCEVWDYVAGQLQQEIGMIPAIERVRLRLHDLGMDQHCGGFNFRNITAGSALSLHAYGIAIDMDAAHNPRGHDTQPRFPEWYFDIWLKHGWSNGGHFPTPDWMHFQFATGA